MPFPQQCLRNLVLTLKTLFTYRTFRIRTSSASSWNPQLYHHILIRLFNTRPYPCQYYHHQQHHHHHTTPCVQLLIRGRSGVSTAGARGLVGDMGTLRPTVMAGVPRVFTKIYDVVEKGLNKSVIKRIVYDLSYGLSCHARIGPQRTNLTALFTLYPLSEISYAQHCYCHHHHFHEQEKA